MTLLQVSSSVSWKRKCSPSPAEPDLDTCTDPHCVASLLKTFLGAMSEPVIPFSEYERVIQNFSESPSPLSDTSSALTRSRPLQRDE